MTLKTVKTLKTLGARAAADLDAALMSPDGGDFSLDQLMELAGLAVSQAVDAVQPPAPAPAQTRVLVACGPGNNGGDGLVAARHLRHYGYAPAVFYPRPTARPLFERLQTQLRSLDVPITTSNNHDDFVAAFEAALARADLVVDALFGFSFRPPVRPPFDRLIGAIVASRRPVLAVDVPSGWDVEAGPPPAGAVAGDFMPDYLVSLTAAKPCVAHFRGKRHFVGGRFLAPALAARYGLDVPDYAGVDQTAELEVGVAVEKL